LAPFAEDFAVVNTESLSTQYSVPGTQYSHPREADLLDALILGLKDYARKSGFRDCVLGLSGGIDSALACYLAARALGAAHVHEGGAGPVPDDNLPLHADEGPAHEHEHDDDDTDYRPFSGHSDMGHIEQHDHL
jgi:asparagine synthetase B (glutamine-hydrolysing)